jgi:hypothetical protein
MPGFDIREWRARHGLPERIEDPAQIKSAVALLSRDLMKRFAASGESRRLSQGRTVRRNADDGRRTDSASA